MNRVLVAEESDLHAQQLGALLARCGFSPVVRNSIAEADVWDVLSCDTYNFIAVVTWYLDYPIPDIGKRKRLQEAVHLVKPCLPVLAVNVGGSGNLLNFDSEFHFGGNIPPNDAREVLVQHLNGTCVVCARYRS